MLSRFSSIKLLKNVSKLSMVSSNNLLHTSQTCYKKKRKSGCGPPKVAVILCGCGALDGTEISEAISASIHLSSKNLLPNFYAPEIDICGPVNHLTKDPETCGPKSAIVEGARIARGSIQPLSKCTACDNEALIIPGGFGVARTLSDFASKGSECIVNPDLDRIIKEFNCADKPIGSICIAAAIVAKVLSGAKVTLGKECPKEQWPYSDAIEQVKKMGSKIELKDVKGVTYCKEFNVYSTPAWMDAQATYKDVHDGIGKMTNMLAKCIK